MRLICLGDSLTFGHGVPRRAGWPALFAGESGWAVVNCGVSGDTTGGMLARLRQEVLPRLPAAPERGRVLVMGGSNDVFYSGTDAAARANLGAITQQLLAAGAAPLVGVPLPVDWADTPEAWRSAVDFRRAAEILAEYADWLRRFAPCFGLPVVDFGGAFLTPEGLPRREWLLDGIHPNAAGHWQMAGVLRAALEAAGELF